MTDMSERRVHRRVCYAPFASYEESFPHRSLSFDCPCMPPVHRSSITSAFVHEYKLVREIAESHMLAEFLALELVAFDRDLRQLKGGD